MAPNAKPPGSELAVPLDAVFRRNATTRPEAVALLDPPDREAFTEGLPRRMTYASADAAAGRLARQFVQLGLPAGAVVAVHMPNIVEHVIALLAIERAGLVAAPLPLAWRKADLVRALKMIEATALITVARAGDELPATNACAAAAEVLSLSFPCAFGSELPDGVIALDIDQDRDGGTPLLAAERLDQISMLTLDADRNGPLVVGRNHGEWIAAGLGTVIEAQVPAGAAIVACLPPASLAGIGGALVPWLLTGGSLQLLHGFSRAALERAAPRASRACLVAPAGALGALQAASGSFAAMVGVHRGPTTQVDASADSAIVDLQVFGEVGAIARRRTGRGPEPIPIGRVSVAQGPAAPVGIETRIEPDQTVALRGAMVPHQAFAAAGARALAIGADGFVRTNCRCRAENAFGMVIESGPAGVAAIGGLRFALDDLEARVKAVAPAATITYTSDALLGGRLAIEAVDAAATSAALEAAGFPQVVLDAVVPLKARQRKAS
jgi:hypothetical protein